MSEVLLPEGAIIKVELEVRLPVAATYSQVDEYLSYEMTQSGGCALDNPLMDSGVDAWTGVELNFTGKTGHREKYDITDLPDGGTQYRVRKILTPVQ